MNGRVIGLLVIVAVILGGVSALSSSPSAAHDHFDNDTQNYTETVLLWSLDNETGFPDGNFSQRKKWGPLNLTSRAEDKQYGDPKGMIAKWNRENVDEFVGGGTNRSIYPTNTELSNGTYIKDAWVEIHSISPSTYAHVGEPYGIGSGREDYHMINPYSDVNIIFDYRVIAPDETNRTAEPPNGEDADYDNETYIIREIEDSKAKRVWYTYNGVVMAEEQYVWEHGLTLEPEEAPGPNKYPRNTSDTNTIVAYVNFTTTINETVWNENETCDPCHDHDKTWYHNTQKYESEDAPSGWTKFYGHDDDTYEVKTDSADPVYSCTGFMYNGKCHNGELVCTSDCTADYETRGHDHDPTYYDEKQKAETCPWSSCANSTGHDHDESWRTIWTRENNTITEHVVVSDKMDNLTRYWFGGRVEYTKLPRGNNQVSVTGYSEGGGAIPLWDGVQLPSGREVNSKFEYYTTRNPYFDRVNISSRTYDRYLRNKSEAKPRAYWKQHSMIRPAKLHAYPKEDGFYVGSKNSDNNFMRVTAVEFFQRNKPPTIDDNVSVDHVDNNYAVNNQVVFQLPYTRDYQYVNSERGVTGMQLTGIVYNSSPNIRNQTAYEVEVNETNIDIEQQSVNKKQTLVRYKITITDSDGNPVDTTQRGSKSYVVVDGQQKDTASDGTVTATFNYSKTDVFVVKFSPHPWYEPTYTGGGSFNERLEPKSKSHAIEYDPQAAYLMKLIFYGVVPFLPILLLIYLIDRTLDIGIWPIWRGRF